MTLEIIQTNPEYIVREVSKMEFPDQKNYPPQTPHELEWGCVGSGFYDAMKLYRDHIASLQTYTLITNKKHEIGDKVHVRLQWQERGYNTNRWQDCTEREYKACNDSYRRIVAIEIEQERKVLRAGYYYEEQPEEGSAYLTEPLPSDGEGDAVKELKEEIERLNTHADDLASQKDYWYNRCYQAELVIESISAEAMNNDETKDAVRNWMESKTKQ